MPSRPRLVEQWARPRVQRLAERAACLRVNVLLSERRALASTLVHGGAARTRLVHAVCVRDLVCMRRVLATKDVALAR